MEACTGSTERLDIIPSIMNAFSFNNDSEEIIRRNSSDNGNSRSHSEQQPHIHSIEIPLVRNSAESSHRRRRERQQQQNNTEKPPLTDNEEEVNFLDVFPAIMDVCSINDDRQSTTYDKTNKVRSNDKLLSSTRASHSNNGSDKTIQNGNDEISSSILNVFSMVDGNILSKSVHNISADEIVSGQVFPSIRNVLSMDDGGTKETQNNIVVGNSMSEVYPFMRNVFSMNGIGMNGTQNSTEEILDSVENVDPSVLSLRRDEEKGKAPQRKSKPTQKILVTRAYEVKEHYFESIFYISISAILGSVFRVYMARIFGFDCEYKYFNDFFIPLTSNICVTNDGRSEQTGGALFIDFPSNVFGSFLMGMITPPVNKRRARLPWLHRDHPLQRDEVFHASLGTGFCGCLTTFASWNTQMVVMLDGTHCELGSQVVTVLFGYLIGLMGAAYGFQLGRQCGLWMYNYRHRQDDEVSSRGESGDMDESCVSESHASFQNVVELSDEGVELVDDDNVTLQPVPSHLHKVPLFLTAVALLIAFIIGDLVNGIEFYKGMTLLWILSPVGSLLRWRLSNLNLNKRGRIFTNSPEWIPWGTFVANVLASIISACMEGLNNRHFSGANPTLKNQWVDAMLFALKTGVAGSLSTVSTMVKESVLLSEDHPGKALGHYYSTLTCVSGCLLGLLVYVTTIRINSEML